MTDGLSKSYTLAKGPPHIPIDEYADNCNRQYSELLSKNPPEKDMQSFLEKHPVLVPGHTPPWGGNHSSLHCALITQPELRGIQSFVPDFMWITSHSGAWFPTLIEIEKPDRKIFTKKGDPYASFTHARQQLADWRSWFNNPTNVLQFLEIYGIPDLIRRRTMYLRMILIYGRRAEFEEDPKLTGKISSLLPCSDEGLMSFDRLCADRSRPMKDAITVKSTGSGKYQAVWVPPVFETGPVWAERFIHIEGIPEAIDQNGEIDKDRREFLKERITYWKKWASSPGVKLHGAADRE